MPELHPSQTEILRFFEYEHLSGDLREISMRFHELAHGLKSEALFGRVSGPELTVALRKLLEAKDAAVRAAL